MNVSECLCSLPLFLSFDDTAFHKHTVNETPCLRWAADSFPETVGQFCFGYLINIVFCVHLNRPLGIGTVFVNIGNFGGRLH